MIENVTKRLKMGLKRLIMGLKRLIMGLKRLKMCGSPFYTPLFPIQRLPANPIQFNTNTKLVNFKDQGHSGAGGGDSDYIVPRKFWGSQK